MLQSIEARPRPFWLVVRALVLLGVLAWGWYILAMFRTQQFGFSLEILGLTAAFVLPVVWLPFVGLRRSIALLGAAITLFAILVAVESFALVEEIRFGKAHAALPPNAGVVVRERQWPFSSHYLYYDPATGHWGGGD